MNSKRIIGAILLVFGLLCSISGGVLLINIADMYRICTPTPSGSSVIGSSNNCNMWDYPAADTLLTLTIIGAILLVVGALFLLLGRKKTVQQHKPKLSWKHAVPSAVSVVAGLAVLIGGQNSIGGILPGIMMIVAGAMIFAKPRLHRIWGGLVILFSISSPFMLGAFNTSATEAEFFTTLTGWFLGFIGGGMGMIWKYKADVSEQPIGASAGTMHQAQEPTSQNLFCHNCGARIKLSESKFCSKCGTPLMQEESQTVY